MTMAVHDPGAEPVTDYLEFWRGFFIGGALGIAFWCLIGAAIWWALG